ncbi:FAD-binding oxidoreductase [Rhizobium acidisoli]|uniref:FAD-binding oxidoreductase n=1 Tax=Rhizobium acidisoli TaxID=1538158 RepID=A0AAE5WNK7_9HYPH|nr:FAD-binding oxidoreductase [Rhizobium acidisoli]KPH06088.1 amino acid dehydrogenase [Rhizobium acidisoli]QAS78516.1 FAD-binding oxidoreductase [Rhizobium acidisoli]
MRVAVIGAGIVGACCALELIRDGHDVTIVEPGAPGGPQSASYGHGCWISPASVVPMSMPGLWRRVPGYLLDARGPLVIRWRHIVPLMPWILRFLMAGATDAKVEKTAMALAGLLGDSPRRHAELAAEIGRPELIRNDGVLYVYPDRQALEADGLAWRLRCMAGVRWTELDREALREREVNLADRYALGLLVEDGSHCVDPAAYVGRLVDVAVERGALSVQGVCKRIASAEDQAVTVEMDTGETIACDRVVIAAGIWSKALARQAGDRIPLESERGYHAEIEGTKNGPCHPVMPSDGRMANTQTLRGLRLSGQVELACTQAPANWQRLDILIEHARKTYPALNSPDEWTVNRWMGHRPSTPDGLPVIGPSSGSPDILYAFGHGHVGFASGPITGRIVADLVSGARVPADVAAFSARRFK